MKTEDNLNIFIIGGAKSGKSRHALETGQKYIDNGISGKGMFIATATSSDEEMAERIRLHRRERGKQWVAMEEPIRIYDAINRDGGEFDIIIVDCLTLWLSNIMLHGYDFEEQLARLLKALEKSITPVILVSNETGYGIVPQDALSRRFRDMAGIMNRMVAAQCGTAVMVVAGLPLILKQRR